MKFSDVAARVLITAAGIGTIVAIGTVCFFLVSVVLPLFAGGEVHEGDRIESSHREEASVAPIRTDTDEYGVLGWSYFPDGHLAVFRLESGEVLRTFDLFDGASPTCESFLLRGGDAIFGFEDGTVRFASIRFETSYPDLTEVEDHVRALAVGESTVLGDGVVEMTPLGQLRLQQAVVEVQDPVEVAADSPVVLVDMIRLSSGPVLTALTADMTLHVKEIRETRNIMTGKTTVRLSGGQAAITGAMADGRGHAEYMIFEGRGDTVTLAWSDGYAARFDTRNINDIVFAESVRFIEDDARITALTTMIGKMTMVIGDSRGRVSTWFRVKPSGVFNTTDGLTVVEADDVFGPVRARLREARGDELPEGVDDPAGLLVVPTSDASVLVRQHVLGDDRSEAVSALAVSKRRRVVTAGYGDGTSRMFHVTSDQLLAEMNVFPDEAPISAITMGPKDDFIVFTAAETMARWTVDMPHPQTTFDTIFTKVWYEGFERPDHVWQSTSGSDAFEPKYGLMPLIFGTLKATVYTMLFGTPLALLAAVYSSEFLHPRTKAKFKPTIEIMASLPSVVLGFLAALVFAPVIEDIVPHVLTAAFTIPFVLLLAAFVWQLLPPHLLVRLRPLRLTLMFVMLPVGVLAGFGAGPIIESVFFGGDIKGWLAWMPDPAEPAETASSPYRHAIGGWFLLLLPLSALVVAYACGRFINPLVRTFTAEYSRLTTGVSHLVKFLAGTVITLLLALGLAAVMSAADYDPRGLVVGTYIQRNAMIVGFVMGFAVIPIIYTLAEDALSAVPEHLRAASLGAGATPWQTATRIIIPTAMSGLFSAVMIGLGRAVGETMIVLMAAGNTPIMDWNMFSGFRTLSANIAVELPEAVQDGTNFRMLFLAALTLFAMTFLVNTLAEAVRLRFRKRAYAL